MDSLFLFAFFFFHCRCSLVFESQPVTARRGWTGPLEVVRPNPLLRAGLRESALLGGAAGTQGGPGVHEQARLCSFFQDLCGNKNCNNIFFFHLQIAQGAVGGK